MPKHHLPQIAWQIPINDRGVRATVTTIHTYTNTTTREDPLSFAPTTQRILYSRTPISVHSVAKCLKSGELGMDSKPHNGGGRQSNIFKVRHSANATLN